MKSGQSPWTRVAGHPTMGFLYERYMVENGWMEVSVYIVLTCDATFFLFIQLIFRVTFNSRTSEVKTFGCRCFARLIFSC